MMRDEKMSKVIYALVSDCTPHCGTVEAVSADAGELYDAIRSDDWRAIRVDSSVSVGDRIDIDWDAQSINLADCL